MTYTQSIRAITVADAHYFRLCDLAETDNVIGEALACLHKLKAEHKAKFGTLGRVNGQWV
jgi:hypothetical protein